MEFRNEYVKHFHPCNVQYFIPYYDEFIYCYLNNVKMKIMLISGPIIETIDKIHEQFGVGKK